MRLLPLPVSVLGHRLVAAPLMGGLAVGFVLLAPQGQAGLLVAMLLLIPATWVLRAATAVQRQRQWRAAWDGMAGQPARQPVGWARKLLAAILVALVAFYLAANPDRPGHMLALGWMMLVLIGLGVVALIRAALRWLGGRSARPARQHVVTVVARTGLPVPSLTDAYGALPPHCWDAIGR